MNIQAGRLLAAGSAVAVLALSGCGGGGGDRATDTSATPTSAAPSTAAAADASSGSLADVLTKAVQEGRSAHVAVDLGRQGGGEGDISFGDGKPAMRMRVSFGSRTTEIRLVDGTVYVAVPGRDGKYMKMDLGRAGSALGIDPSKALTELQEKSGEFTQVGDGHWQARHDGATTDVYVGSDGFPQKVQVTGVGTGPMTVTFSDWGEPVTVTAPSAGDLVRGPMV
jgi:hypothetical protein